MDRQALTDFFIDNLDIAVRNGDECRIAECIFCGTPRTMKVNVRTGRYICFHKHCMESGTRIGLVMALLGCGWEEAVDHVSALMRGSRRTDETNQELRERLVNTERRRAAAELVVEPGLPEGFALATSGPGFEYLTETRGLTPAQIEEWGIGFVGWGKLADRVVVPIRTAGATTWVARAIHADMAPKYRTPRGGPTKVLFGYDRIPHGADLVVACEGVFDAIRLWSYGYYAVAYLKDGLSLDQVCLLEALEPKRLVLFPDGGDMNAQRRAVRDAINLGSRFDDVRVVLVAPTAGQRKLDPDSGPREIVERSIADAQTMTRTALVRYGLKERA